MVALQCELDVRAHLAYLVEQVLDGLGRAVNVGEGLLGAVPTRIPAKEGLVIVD